MAVVIFVFEILSAIPIVNWFTTPFLYLMLWLARHEAKVNIFEPGRVGVTILVFFVELIPFAKLAPTVFIRWVLAKPKQSEG